MDISNFHSLHLGDSYTIGECVPQDQNWPFQLSRQLVIDWGLISTPTIIAKSSWTTQDLMGALNTVSLNSDFDLVSLMVGVNNQYRGLSLDEYRSDLKFLLEKSSVYARSLPSRVMVLSIPDWGVTPHANDHDSNHIRVMIDAFNKVNEEETRAFGASWIDVTTISREAILEPGMIAGDQLHPSPELYAVWVAQVAPVARKILAA